VYFIYLLHKKELVQFRASLFLLNNANANGEPYEYQIIYPCFFDTLTATAPSSNIVNAAPAPKPVLGDLSPSLFTF